ncbi:alpha/beta hydrolase [Nocardia sp. ET3-3]|uniref:Alpha/beta hydrolase n=2 Tax=Nocardia terrae TaxID=2675851 RepID=A0A7K1UW03_9NOCA|nr:alpha/beta hydrolase [Nocardia terrae]
MIVPMVTVVGYIGYVAVRRGQQITLPAPTGPYAVGRTTVDWTDDTRADPLAPRPGMPRELSVWLWYPAAPDPGAAPAPYAPGAWSGLHVSGLPGLGETGFDHVRVHAVADAPVAVGRFPVVVLEPGLGLAAPQYTTLAENLASHGYLVAGITPTYSAKLTVLNGRAVAATSAGNPQDSDTAAMRAVDDRLVGVWAADDRFVATELAGLDATGRFAGHIDAATTVYLGHSFGGAAALQACHDDVRCVGAADLDGTQFGDVVGSGLAKPMMLLASQSSCVTGICRPGNASEQAAHDAAHTLLTASTGPVWSYRLNGSEHFNFSDYGAYYLALPLRSAVGLGSIDGDVALTITDAYLVAFVDQVTRGQAEPLLAGASSPYSQVEVQHTG